MRRLPIALLLLALLPARAMALNTTELLSAIAMPLAVAAVSNVSGVPQDQLATLVSTLNQANVPPTQFVQVIRYVPVALVDQNGQPFIAYVQDQTAQGITGDRLVDLIAQRLQSSYGVRPQIAISTIPSTTLVVEDNYIPQDVLMRLGTTSVSDPLTLIGLPLAVAAVSNIIGVPQDELANLVATLNQANVPVVQEVQLIRYVPVALVSDSGQPFVQFVQQQVSQGVIGPALVPVVTQQLQTYYPASVVVSASPPSRTVVVERDFVPRVVISRVEEVRAHPHGGPPGQLKKQLGLQTGAEVVHGEKPGRQFLPAPVAVVPVAPKEHGHGKGHAKEVPMASSAPPQPKVEEHGHGRGHEAEQAQPPVVVAAPPAAAPVPVAAPAGKGHGNEGGPPGQQKPKGGKGHGKD